MKPINLLLFLISFHLLILSCSNNNEIESEIIYNGTQSDLTGTWNLESVKYKGFDLTLDVCDLKENIIIDSKGNAVWEYPLSSTDTPINITDPNMCNFLTEEYTIIDSDKNYFKIDINRFIVENRPRYNGKFLSNSKITITEVIDGNYTVYVFYKK